MMKTKLIFNFDPLFLIVVYAFEVVVITSLLFSEREVNPPLIVVENAA